MKSDRIYLSRSLPIVRDRSLLKIARVAVIQKRYLFLNNLDAALQLIVYLFMVLHLK